MSELKKRPLIIDCDPGEDDAIAIFMMLAAPEFEVLGLCPVNGNKPLAMTEKNALKLLELAKRDIPVLKGARKAIFRDQRDAGNIHGSTGLGVDLPEPEKKVSDQHAWDFYYEMACRYPGELEILAIGPLTNLAITMIKYPDFAEKVKVLSVMGGCNGVGNYGNPAAEFNIWADPDAAKMVFAAGIPMAMMGLDICFRACLTPERVRELEEAGTPVCSAAAQLVGKRVEGGLRRGFAGAVVCDAVAAAWLIDPSVLTTETVNVDVETTAQMTEAKTVITRFWTEHVTKKANCELGLDADTERYGALVVRLLKDLDASIGA